MSVRYRKRKSAPKGRRQTARRRSYSRRRVTTPGNIIIKDGKLFLMIPGKLRSPNKLKSGIARHGDTKGWEARIEKCMLVQVDQSVDPPKTVGKPDRRAKLTITRMVPNKACFLDRTNLAFSVKGLEDALVRLGYLVDDNLKWLDGPYVEQELSPDKEYWAAVIIEYL